MPHVGRSSDWTAQLCHVGTSAVMRQSRQESKGDPMCAKMVHDKKHCLRSGKEGIVFGRSSSLNNNGI